MLTEVLLLFGVLGTCFAYQFQEYDSNFYQCTGGFMVPDHCLIYDDIPMPDGVTLSCKYNWNDNTWDDINAVTSASVMFSTHFDFGYSEHMWCTTSTWINRLFSEAVQTVTERPDFVITLHPFLVWIMSHCEDVKEWYLPAPGTELICPPHEQRLAFIEKCKSGNIVWGRFIWDGFNELLDPTMVQYGFDFVDQLNNDPIWDGKVKNAFTMFQFDVPGLSVAQLPILQKNGVKAVYVGMNPESFIPEIPRIFRWTHPEAPENDAGVLTLTHPRGYGGLGHRDAFIDPRSGSALMTSSCAENTHTSSPADAEARYQKLMERFPNVPRENIKETSLDTWIAKILPYANEYPHLTLDIGDQWLRNALSDPKRIMMMRAMLRVRQKYLQDPATPRPAYPSYMESKEARSGGTPLNATLAAQKAMWDASVLIMQTTEHNFGIGPPANAPLAHGVSSWVEKRKAFESAINILKTNPTTQQLGIGDDMEAALDELVPTPLDETQWESTDGVEFRDLQCGNWNFSISNRGGINHLVDVTDPNLTEWATETNQLGALAYSSCFPDLQMTELFKANASVTKIWNRVGADNNCSIVVESMMRGSADNRYLKVQTQFDFPDIEQGITCFPRKTSFRDNILSDHLPHASCINITLQLWDIPFVEKQYQETCCSYTPPVPFFLMNFAFHPTGVNGQRWQWDVLDSLLNATDVVKCGTQHYHTVWKGVHNQDVHDGKSLFSVLSQDGPLFSWGNAMQGEGNVYNTIPAAGWDYYMWDQPADLDSGFSYNLFNTLEPNWVRIFPYVPRDQNMKWRFQMCLANWGSGDDGSCAAGASSPEPLRQETKPEPKKETPKKETEMEKPNISRVNDSVAASITEEQVVIKQGNDTATGIVDKQESLFGPREIVLAVMVFVGLVVGGLFWRRASRKRYRRLQDEGPGASGDEGDNVVRRGGGPYV